MIDYENTRAIVVKGLKDYLKCPVIRQNQNENPPAYPYLSYTVTQLMSQNNGTYGEYEDGKDRKPYTMTMSITSNSDDNSESVTLAVKAREWLDRVGTTHLNDNNVIVQSVGSITNRDNILTVDYEYRNGFDAVFWLFDTVDNPIAKSEEYIETTDISGQEVEQPKSVEELTEMLENRLNGGD